MNMNEWTSKCVVSTIMVVAIAAGLYFTKDSQCLIALFFPFWVMVKA